MVLNYIWIAFFLIAFLIATIRLVFFGDVDVFPAIVNSTFDTSKTAFEISLGLTGVLSLWLGIMKIGEKGGIVNALARVLSPVFEKLFPEIPRNHPVIGNIFMNISANMLGLVCDPVRGLVEYPCQLRNASGVANAVSAAQLALSGVGSPLPFDEVVEAMRQVGQALPASLRETALGGLAAAPSACSACCPPCAQD